MPEPHPSCGHLRAYPRPAARPPQYPDYGLEPDIVVPGYWGLYDFEYKFNLSLLAGVCFFVALLGRVILVRGTRARQQPVRRNRPRLRWIMGDAPPSAAPCARSGWGTTTC